jgi:hypothetical protein
MTNLTLKILQVKITILFKIIQINKTYTKIIFIFFCIMYQKPIEIRARLRKPYYANFLDYFHDNSNEDHFYKILQNKCSNHLIKSKILETN